MRFLRPIRSSTRPACIVNAFATREAVLFDVPTRLATTRGSGASPCDSSNASNTLALVIIRAGWLPDETSLVSSSRSFAVKQTNSKKRGTISLVSEYRPRKRAPHTH